jgi:hypothetical protein
MKETPLSSEARKRGLGMMRAVALPVLAGTLVGLPARDALAQGPSCSQVAVEADASLETRWPDLTQRVRDAFEAREDVDRCARILLSLHEAVIGVEVVLLDGRSAQRSVSRRDDVVPALEALLIVPPAPLARAVPTPPATTTTSAPSMLPMTPHLADSAAPTAASAPVREAPGARPTQPSSHLRIELSVLTGARIGDGQASVGLGALSFLDLSEWLVGFAGRADRYETLDGTHPASALELALLGGRRLRFRTMALDLVGGPAVALGGTTTYATASPTGNGQSASASNTAPRLLVEARLVFAALSTVRTFVAVDGDFGPANSPDASLLPNAPHLPTWTAGLALGATVGTP